MSDTEYVRPAGDVSYLVMCGVDREPVNAVLDERRAYTLAVEHGKAHGCYPWVQYPLQADHA